MADSYISSDRLYFQAHGLEVEEPSALEAAVRQAIQRLPLGLYTESSRGLPECEIDLLRAGGLNPVIEVGPDPLAETTSEFAALLRTSLSTAEAAAQLGVHVSRIRRMIAAGTLYGFQVDGKWQVPQFQFTEAGLIPNLGPVLAALDRTLHPVAICRWLTRPDTDLDANGLVLSPLAWLSAGYNPETVRQIAADL